MIKLHKHSEFCKCESCVKPILKWTKELPIKEGWYWVKFNINEPATPMYWTGIRWTNMDTYEDLFGEVKE